MIIAILMLSMMAVPSHAADDTYTAETTTADGVTVKWSYELEDGNIVNLKCTNISAISGKVEIPSTIDEKTVTTIGADAFNACHGLTEITFPDTITYIGKSQCR